MVHNPKLWWLSGTIGALGSLLPNAVTSPTFGMHHLDENKEQLSTSQCRAMAALRKQRNTSMRLASILAFTAPCSVLHLAVYHTLFIAASRWWQLAWLVSIFFWILNSGCMCLSDIFGVSVFSFCFWVSVMNPISYRWTRFIYDMGIRCRWQFSWCAPNCYMIFAIQLCLYVAVFKPFPQFGPEYVLACLRCLSQMFSLCWHIPLLHRNRLLLIPQAMHCRVSILKASPRGFLKSTL